MLIGSLPSSSLTSLSVNEPLTIRPKLRSGSKKMSPCSEAETSSPRR
jgi:hypothetical protein